jgi:hypothetical protein
LLGNGRPTEVEAPQQAGAAPTSLNTSLPPRIALRLHLGRKQS